MIAALAIAAGLALPACDSSSSGTGSPRGIPAASDVSLVRFSSCADALRNLRGAAAIAMSRTAIATGSRSTGGAPAAAPALGNAPQANAPQIGASGQLGSVSQPGAYSTTNNAVAGVDEPDLVKTDGTVIVTVIGNMLRVVDVRTRQVTGQLDLSAWAGAYGGGPANLLLYGSRALVLFDQGFGYPAVQTVPAVSPAAALPIVGPRLLLVDLSTGAPQVISQYTISGSLVDARQVGPVVRVIVHSAPELFAPGPLAGGMAGGSAGPPSDSVARDGISAWLPRYQVTDRSGSRTALVSCADVSHPMAMTYTGTSMLTVLTFDLNADTLGDGLPVTIVADGNTVYSNGTSLYVASDQQWSAPLQPQSQSMPAQSAVGGQYVSLYKFSTFGPGRPLYEASGTVPGWLLGPPGLAQYALSEWNGALRVATTTGNAFAAGWQPPRSAVYELEQVGSQLAIIGKVGGLGAGEQVYAVRFAGPVGYVVTFRQVDPLYTLDLSNPAAPRLIGSLMLSGYSAYLDPISPTRLIGVGQDANATGLTTGTQVSLFDTSDLAAPVRLAVFHLPFAHSEAEFDPHAFLYWPASGLLVIPVQLPGLWTTSATPTGPASEAVVLQVGDHSLTEVGVIRQPAVPGWPGGGEIRRSLVAGGALWTVSEAGLKANDLATLVPEGWIPFG